MWNRASLRTRITLSGALIIIMVCGFLTGILLDNAGDSFPPTTHGRGDATSGEVDNDLYITTAEPIQDLKQGLTQRSLIYMAATVLVGVVATWFFARRALRPLSQLSQLMENIDVNNLSQPIPVPQSKDEVARLTRSFNTMLLKLNFAFQGQKRFVQNAAHELKTPVAAILTNIEVLELDEEPSLEDYKDVIRVTKENTQRMSALVQDLLMVNVESMGHFTWFSFNLLVEEIREDLVQESEKWGVSITVQGDLMLQGNRTMLKRAFHNIIHNAIRYNRQGGRIDILCREGQITIADTGIGIPEDKLDMVFEPFYCVDASRSRQLGGSGLGLAMVKQIFDQHNFQVQLRSTESQGTKFTVSLPS